MRKKGNDDMKQDKQAGGLAGIYQATSRGFGFLVPEDGGGREDDWFIPPRAEGGAWHGDRVLARPEDEGGEEGRRRTARITAVVERANKTVTSVLVRHNRGLWLRPDSDRLPGPIQVLTKRKGVRAGDRAAVAMTSFGSAKHPPMGTMREVFGPAGDRESAVAAILYQYEIEREFPDAVMLEAKATPQSVEESAVAGRLDLRDKVVITIDGASSKDLDDAVSLERDGLGRWVLGVHIADVSHYVRPGLRPGSGGLGAGHLGVLCRPGGAHAAPGAVQWHLLPQPPGGPAGPVLRHDPDARRGRWWTTPSPRASSAPRSG